MTHGSSPMLLINKLNPVIRGYANSKRAWASNRIFRDLDHYIFDLCWRWMRRQHPNKSIGWMRKRYFTHLRMGNIDNRWVFTGVDPKAPRLLQFKWFPIERHIMIRNAANPDDPEYASYWEDLKYKRQQMHRFTLVNKLHFDLAVSQKHICSVCFGDIYNGEELHVHHLLEKSKGGKNTFVNLLLLHLPCHFSVYHFHGETKRLINEELRGFRKVNPRRPRPGEGSFINLPLSEFS